MTMAMAFLVLSMMEGAQISVFAESSCLLLQLHSLLTSYQMAILPHFPKEINYIAQQMKRVSQLARPNHTKSKSSELPIQ
jgi:hypothetical protein